MADTFTPGLLKNLTVLLKNADGSKAATITNLVMQLSITEDIFKNTLYGSVRIRDASDLLNGLPSGFPIIGEEFLEIEYSVDWTPAPVKVSLRFAVYGIEQISYAKNNTLKEYTLNFCSEEHFIDATSVIMKAYTGTHSDNVKSVLQDFLFIDKQDTPFKGKRIKTIDKLEPTKGIQNICIPRLSPLQAAQFLARRSISDSNFESGTYLFFENFRGFNFCDIEYLIKAGIEKANKARPATKPDSDYHYFFENPLVATEREREVRTILKMTHKNYFDTIQKLKNGMFESDVLVYDYVNHKTIPTRFRFLNNQSGDNNKSLTLGGDKQQNFPENSITFMKSVTSTDDKDIKYSRFFFIPKDLSNTMGDTFLDQIYPARASYFTRLAQNMMTLDVYGNPNINAGDVVYINVPEDDPNIKEGVKNNIYISGYYMVCTINHILTQTTYQAKWDIYKNAFSSQVKSTKEAEATKVTPTDGKSITNDYGKEQDLFPPALPEVAQEVVPFLKQFVG
jgi:hypothetical protein